MVARRKKRGEKRESRAKTAKQNNTLAKNLHAEEYGKGKKHWLGGGVAGGGVSGGGGGEGGGGGWGGGGGGGRYRQKKKHTGGSKGKGGVSIVYTPGSIVPHIREGGASKRRSLRIVDWKQLNWGIRGNAEQRPDAPLRYHPPLQANMGRGEPRGGGEVSRKTKKEKDRKSTKTTPSTPRQGSNA